MRIALDKKAVSRIIVRHLNSVFGVEIFSQKRVDFREILAGGKYVIVDLDYDSASDALNPLPVGPYRTSAKK